ncbi:Rossmann-fold NAD(P)-binding domain-containing protein [Nocardiopsis suaedae]|uniref:Ergot alkaloid biosynthesis protein n=1 Tax=Nocardiopsis suaedae TaxID=3018444 RepID=A0ABT4TPU6_9ACTN|nr:ergot alkaloid biosynthesis protein [Nocardiopsis suaedae]MDA2806708.1 ergot alkaloid biosynthesis protein [Nocardiopsis suaedae]
MSVLVTGGTGTTGSRVARKLAERGVPHRVASRRAAGGRVPFDWYDSSTHAGALAGATALYLVAPIGEPDPEPVMAPFLERAAEAGVRRAVLLSGAPIEPGTPGLGRVHSRLGGLVPEWAVLRPTWFADNFTGDHLQARLARERGEIVSATGTGRVPFVAAEDIAEVAVAALTGTAPHGTDHVLTGPRAVTYDEAAEALGRVLGRAVRHRRLSADELAGFWAQEGMRPEFARLLADMDTAIAAGAEDRTTTAVLDTTGRPPRALEEAFAEALAAR